ncbi:Zn-ribbon-containing [Nonlabens ulvanivorans]|nr:DUF721 domain-containing protein [Nonlabens ulvanivorans]GAK90757.1 Zn-ribbon-containing [Nonlabens ulvanivorans]
MRKNKKDDFLNMSEALNDFKSQNKLQKGFARVDVETAWKEVMGNGIMTYTTQIKYSGTTLFISLSSSVLREELLYGRTKIMENLNRHLGSEMIDKLVLR